MKDFHLIPQKSQLEESNDIWVWIVILMWIIYKFYCPYTGRRLNELERVSSSFGPEQQYIAQANLTLCNYGLNEFETRVSNSFSLDLHQKKSCGHDGAEEFKELFNMDFSILWIGNPYILGILIWIIYKLYAVYNVIYVYYWGRKSNLG